MSYWTRNEWIEDAKERVLRMQSIPLRHQFSLTGGRPDQQAPPLERIPGQLLPPDTELGSQFPGLKLRDGIGHAVVGFQQILRPAHIRVCQIPTCQLGHAPVVQ